MSAGKRKWVDETEIKSEKVFFVALSALLCRHMLLADRPSMTGILYSAVLLPRSPCLTALADCYHIIHVILRTI